MVIVGSRGLGKLKGILLGSTSHYLVQKSSVPVMVSFINRAAFDARSRDAVYNDLYVKRTHPICAILLESALRRPALKRQRAVSRRMTSWMLQRQKRGKKTRRDMTGIYSYALCNQSIVWLHHASTILMH